MEKSEQLLQLLQDGKYKEAQDLCSFEEAKKLADAGDGAAALATAFYYYNGIGVKQSIGSTLQYCTKADKLGRHEAALYRKRWEKREVSKNVIGIVTFFEMFICLPAFFIFGIYCIDKFVDYPAGTKNLLYVALVVPIAIMIWLMRILLKRVNIGMMKVNVWGILLPIFAIPLTILIMLAVYAACYYPIVALTANS